jgi:hypothetical protein
VSLLGRAGQATIRSGLPCAIMGQTCTAGGRGSCVGQVSAPDAVLTVNQGRDAEGALKAFNEVLEIDPTSAVASLQVA